MSEKPVLRGWLWRLVAGLLAIALFAAMAYVGLAILDILVNGAGT